MALSKKQQVFVEHYLICWNATEAAKKAGYSERSAGSIGSENLTKPEIAEAIKSRLKALKISADEVLVRLTEHARGSMADFIEVDTKGQPGVKIKPERLHLLKKLVIRPGEFGTTIEVEPYDAQAALTTLARHHSLLKDKTDWTSDGKPLTFNILPAEPV